MSWRRLWTCCPCYASEDNWDLAGRGRVTRRGGLDRAIFHNLQSLRAGWERKHQMYWLSRKISAMCSAWFFFCLFIPRFLSISHQHCISGL